MFVFELPWNKCILYQTEHWTIRRAVLLLDCLILSRLPFVNNLHTNPLFCPAVGGNFAVQGKSDPGVIIQCKAFHFSRLKKGRFCSKIGKSAPNGDLMPELTEVVLPMIRTNQFPDLQPYKGWQLPNYAGYSLLNIPASLCNLLGIPAVGADPLAQVIVDQLGGPYQKVILLVLDGLGFLSFKNYLRQGLGRVWSKSLSDGFLAPITSLSPSTTAAALTTLWTARSPAEHGIVGYELWLKEYGIVTNMILHMPMSFTGDTGGLKRAGFQPETFLPVATLGPHLSLHNVTTHAFMHQSIVHSGLSMMHFPKVHPHSFQNPGDLWVSVRKLLANRTDERMYIYVYWSDLDELSHRYGPSDERVAIEFDIFSQTLERYFLDQLPSHLQKDTLLIMTADHGLIDTPKNPVYDLRYHPQLLESLHIKPTGENRLAFMHIRPGYETRVRNYLEKTWPGDFTLMSADQVIKSGLFGPGEAYGRLSERMGDLVVLSNNSSYLWWTEKENPLFGRHGGLMPEEMLVPFFALPLYFSFR